MGSVTEQLENVLAYKQIGNPKSERTLIFLHGATMTKEGMLPFAERFPDYNCIVFDLEAHGESGGTEPTEVSQFAKGVEHSIQVLQKEGKITEDLIVMGYSMGGAITCEIAIQGNITLKGIVLLSSGANLDKYTPLVDGLKHVPKEFFDIEDILHYLFGPDSTEEERNAIIKGLQDTKCSNATGYDDLMVANKYNHLSELGKVKVPAMIVHGNDDQIILPMSAIDLWSTLSNSELLMLPYRGHAAILDQGDLIGEKVNSFIKKIK